MERYAVLKVGMLMAGLFLVVSCAEDNSSSGEVNTAPNKSTSIVKQDSSTYQAGEIAVVDTPPQIRNDKNYTEMPDQDLQTLSRSGVARATQELASRSMMKAGNVENAKELLIEAANQGSVEAAGQLALINKKNSDIALAYRNRFGKDYEANEAEAYVWTRVAELRGDRSARLGLIEISDGMSKAQVIQLERLALQQYEAINTAYKKINGKNLSDYPAKMNINDMDASLGSIK